MGTAGPWIEIKVADRGIGLPAGVNVFAAFQQAASDAGPSMGVGLPSGFSLEHNSSLGLTIVSALVDSEMSGVLSMESPANGKGTVVELRIPVHPATVTG